MIDIYRVWAMPNKWTFKIKPIAELLSSEVTGGVWVDPFAGENSPATITNDINPERPTTYHMDALEFLRSLPDCSADGVLYDPPYSARQVRECYDGLGGLKWDGRTTFWSDTKNEVARILKPRGTQWGLAKTVALICQKSCSYHMAAAGTIQSVQWR